MSLQSNSSIWKWKFTTAVRHGSYLAPVLALLLVLPQGHSQTVGTRTSLSVATEGAATRLTVTVKDPTGATVSDGTVSFVSGGVSLGSAFVQGDGTATLTLEKVPANAKQITAVYSGDNSYAASASASVAVQAAATTALPDFSVAANPTSLNLTPGQYGTSIITIAPENGFKQSVTLSLSGLPAGTSSLFTPNIVTPTPTAAVTSTLQIQTTANSSSSMNQGGPLGGNASHLAYAILFPGVLALVGIGALRKRNDNASSLAGRRSCFWSASAVWPLSLLAPVFLPSHHPPAPNPGTPPGSYPITITAYSNNGGEVTSHSVSLTLVVQ